MKSLSLASLAVTLSTLAVLALPSAPAAAQDGVIRCESQNNRERVCSTGRPWRSSQSQFCVRLLLLLQVIE